VSKIVAALLFIILVVIVLAALAGGSGGGNGGGESGESFHQKPAEKPAKAEDSGETFTKENYAQLVSDPDAHEGAKVDVTGQVFTSPEILEGDTAFQIFVDPENGELNTAVLAEGTDLGLEMDDYVHVVGTVTGSMEGENAFGGTVSAVAVAASKIEPVSAVAAVDPAQETVEVGRTLTDQGFSITLKKIEFGEETTRAYVSAYNGTNTLAYFSDYDTKIIQGSRQIDQETAYDYDVKAPQSELNAGVRTEGVVTFGKADSSQPMEVRFEWSSDNYNVTSNPIVFEIANGELSESATGSGAEVSEASLIQAVEDYYQAADREDWAYTYEHLDSQTQAIFTEEEWAKKNEWFADTYPAPLSTLDVQVNGFASDPVVSVTVYRAFTDGTSQTRNTFFLIEDGGWKHRFGQEEIDSFLPDASYEEFVAAQ